jgi:integrase
VAGFVESRNGRYRARFTPPGGRETSETFDRKGDANDWLDEQRGQAVRGTWIDPRGAKTLFGDVAKRYMAGQVHVRESTLAKYEGDLRNHILPAFQDLQLRAIGHTRVQNWVTSLANKGLAPATVESIYRLAGMIFTYAAVDEKLIPESPCTDRINLPKVSKKITIPGLEALELVHPRLPTYYRRCVPTLAGTGLRQGELFGLTLDRIDFLTKQIRVDRQLQRRPRLQAHLDRHGKMPKGETAVSLGDGLFLVDPKSGRSNRVVPVGDFVLGVLSAQVAEFPPTGPGLVFTTSTGRPVARQTVDDAWEKATRKRLASDPGRPDPGEDRGERDPAIGRYFTLHDIRHYFASLLIARGLSVVATAAILGHSPEECMQTYAHLWVDDFDRARAAADAVLQAGGDEVGSDRGLGEA